MPTKIDFIGGNTRQLFNDYGSAYDCCYVSYMAYNLVVVYGLEIF